MICSFSVVFIYLVILIGIVFITVSATRAPAQFGKGQVNNGVSTNGATADFMFFDGGTFWVLPLSYFYLPKSAGAYLFPQSVKIHCFCSGPISVDPICPQPSSPAVGQPGLGI